MRSSRRLAAVAVLIGIALLTGCATIPTSGPVQEGTGSDTDNALELDLIARGPTKGASQAEILLGFIDAAATPQDRYAVAREYLTSSFDDIWDPDADTTIDVGSDREFTTAGDLAMSLSVTPKAAVGQHGDYTEDVPDARVALSYEFQQVRGEWRISKAPQGTLVDEATFPQVFNSYPLYFWDPTYTYMVPDLRWFPRRLSTPTQIVRELLAGPSEWLDGAVVSAFPEGATLTADTVTVLARDAQVPLNSDALRADQETLQHMKQQLKESLSGVPTISSVTIVNNGIERDIRELAPYEIPRVDSRALILRDGVFGYLPASEDTLVPIDGLSDVIASLSPSAVTMGAGRTAAAVLADGVVYSVRKGDDAVALDDRSNLIAPSIDPAGYVWSVPREDPAAIRAYGLDGSVNEVATSWPDSTGIVALRLSRDGTRLIAELESEGRSRFVAAAIIRGDGGRPSVPVKLGTWIPLPSAAGLPVDASWVDDLTVASLTRAADGATTIVTQQIGGPSSEIDGTDDAVGISGGNTVRDLRLLLRDGTLEQRQGIGWQPRITDVQVLATQQGL
ncbi:LpqB family beta-propeller domain-containing protein [Leifsonia sp. YIM 134122]|uniref:LpqB family beta-propeller domain-containing protein n=1 Tax=Leifsonia stereocauli TaxID=3134136 RepID=A0ABU9W6J3_9MICO